MVTECFDEVIKYCFDHWYIWRSVRLYLIVQVAVLFYVVLDLFSISSVEFDFYLNLHKFLNN